MGSGNDLLSNGTKPLSEPRMASHQYGPVTFVWWQFHKRYLKSSATKISSIITVDAEGRDPLKFIVFISSTSLDAREGTEYDNVQKQEAWWN